MSVTVPVMTAETRLLDLIDSDPRVAYLPPGTLMVWVRLARLMDKLGSPTELRFTGTMRGVGDLARWFRLSEAETSSHLAFLVAAGTLTEVADGFDLPEWAAPPNLKARAARENGRKGGRPTRRDGTGQRTILLPITGGRD